MANNEQPTGYNFEVEGKLVKEHECPVCLMLIRNATELPCSHLMCRDCLVHYEEKELERNENAIFVCSLCQAIYDINQKKAVRSTDRTIRESLEVKCKNFKDGCGWVGSISDYEGHHINVCEFLMVECPNNGCKEQIQRRAISSHQESCKYRMVSCEHCQGEFPICWLMDHHETCPSYPVTCKNSCCKELVQRKQMDDHFKNECQYQVIPCIYFEVGCTIQLPRHGMVNHHQEAMQHHTFLLLKSHVDLSKKNQELEKKLKTSNETIGKLQETVMKQEKSIERQQAEVTCLQNDVKEQEELIKSNDQKVKSTEKDAKETFKNLETFAKQTAAYLEAITEKKLSNRIVIQTLYQKDYDENEMVHRFKTQVQEKKDEETDSPYLQVLGKAVKNYNEFYFPKMYAARIQKFANKLQTGDLYEHEDLIYFKDIARCCKSISFKVFYGDSFFNEMKNKNANWQRKSIIHASYYDNAESCYCVAALYHPDEVKEVWLLHSHDEKQNKKLNINGNTLINWPDYMIGTYFVFQIS